MPFKNFSAYLMYQYIRHGDGNYEQGQMEGSTDSGGTGSEPAHAYNTTGTKDFLNDGIYEKIHIASIGASYEMDILPILFEADYSFVYANNFENIEGNTKMKNVLGLKIHFFPEN